MNKFTVCFLSHHYSSPEVFLDLLSRMTPNKSGKWKEMEAITDPFKADYCVVMDGYNKLFPKERTLYFGQHPINASKAFRSFKNVPQLASFPLDKHLNPGDWWIPYDYDTLMAMKPPKKTKDLCSVIIYHKKDRLMRHKRILFMRNLANKYNNVDLYGRPEELYKQDEILKEIYKGCLGKDSHIFDAGIGEHYLGKEKVGDYRYSLEFDVGKTINYLSERFYDAILLWTMPIYFGSTNVEDFVPINSFRYVDLDNYNDENEVQKVIDLVSSSFREENLKAIEEARYLLLNKWATFPYIYSKIKELK